MATQFWSRSAARALDAERSRQRLSVREVARRSGLEPSNVSRKVRGARAISLDEFADVSEALGVDPVEMLRRITDHSTPTAPTPQDLLDHEQSCPACRTLDDAADHLRAALVAPTEGVA